MPTNFDKAPVRLGTGNAETGAMEGDDEAKYIISFWKYGINELWVPKSLDYISQMMPRTLIVVEEQDRIIEDTVERYSNRKIREAIRNRIHLLFTLQVDDEDEEEDVETEDANAEEELQKMENDALPITH